MGLTPTGKVKGQAKITRWVEAALELEVLRAQVERYPRRAGKLRGLINDAIVEKDAAFRALKGGWLTDANRQLAEARAQRAALRNGTPEEEESTE